MTALVSLHGTTVAAIVIVGATYFVVAIGKVVTKDTAAAVGRF
jgi:hypothetical protein